VKTEESLSTLWEDHRLTTACLNGHTLIYDEFNRSRPEANNVLLSILEGRILNLPNLGRSGEGCVRVHEDFRAILTSNPEEYAGVHKTQDALMDRLITINLGHYDRETEIQITQAKSGLPRADAEKIVDIVRELRGMGVNNHRPTIRACIHRQDPRPPPQQRSDRGSHLLVGLLRRSQDGHRKGYSRREIAHAAKGGGGNAESLREPFQAAEKSPPPRYRVRGAHLCLYL